MDASKLKKLISESEAIIGFQPIEHEPDFSAFIDSRKGELVIIPPTREASPEETAEKFSQNFSGKTVVILIPGKVFDMAGTRHGRGGGWYDRFLACVPREWVRVGVLTEEALSKTSLERKSWDEPMDVLLALSSEGVFTAHSVGTRLRGTV